MLSEQYKQKIINIILSVLNDSELKIFLFGSRYKKNNSEYSDIDIGIDCNKPIELYKLGEIKEKLEESNIIYKVDIIDFNNVDKKFKEIVYQEGIEQWYP